VTYEDLTGDYADMPFSAARMSRLRHWSRVDDWRWRVLIPQFCDPIWRWAMQAAAIGNLAPADVPLPRWSAPPPPMVDPVNEGLAYQRLIRSGLETLSNVLRERGYDPAEHFAEMASDNALLDELGIVLDSDPRQMTQAGQAQAQPADDEPDGDEEAEEPTQVDAEADRRARLRLAAKAVR
jgi:capsid protein